MDNERLMLFANFAVVTGINVQRGQTLIINSPIEAAHFVHMCAEAAYKVGAREVVVHYNDEVLNRIKIQFAGEEVLKDIKPWLLQRYMEYVEEGVCVLNIFANNPEIYKGLDVKKISSASKASSLAFKPWRTLTVSNQVQWSVIAVPCKAWAGKVFPDIPAEAAMEKLWEAIFNVCRMEAGKPVEEWKIHIANLDARCAWLNSLNLEALLITAKNGTKLTVGLPDGHVWCGGSQFSTRGVAFLPNIPTEEVFTAPHLGRVTGVVKSSLPYVYHGNLIEGITVRFENGLAVEYSAETGGSLLNEMLNADAGAKRLGEVALVPVNSPVRSTGMLFYNTLFDENAACHIAFGASYPDTLKEGNGMNTEEMLLHGMNDSLIHEDIMIGTPDMNIDGIQPGGGTISIFRSGNWVK